jgi:hypothetical protein
MGERWRRSEEPEAEAVTAIPGDAGGTAPARRPRVAEAERARMRVAAESHLDVYRHALAHKTVTFHDVAGAWFHMSDPELSAADREPFKKLFPKLIDAFAQPRGGIITGYFCRHMRVAAVLTDIEHAASAGEGLPGVAPPAGSPEHHRLAGVISPQARSSAIHLEPTFGDPEDWPAKTILFQCLHLHYKALEFLTPQPRKICMRLIFGVVTALLGTLDARRAPGAERRPFPSEPAELAALQRELDQARDYYERSTQRQAQVEYLLGMLVSVMPIAIAFGVLAATVGVLDKPALVGLFAGAVGAVVSVMARMTNGTLILKPESGKWLIRVLGAFRPVIGAVFGAAVYVLLAGGLVALTAPDPGDEALFYGALGFLAGFSERFAQDAIAGAAKASPVAGMPEPPRMTPEELASLPAGEARG